MPMTAVTVLAVLDRVRAAGLTVWLDGGWGVDALLGAEHREHEDADLVVRLVDVVAVLAALHPMGFEVALDDLPTRMVLTASGGRSLDLHPITFDADGIGWQRQAATDGGDCAYLAEGFTVATILSRPVGCLSPEVQVAHHSGYVPRKRDRDDMARLSARFGLALPPAYCD